MLWGRGRPIIGRLDPEGQPGEGDFPIPEEISLVAVAVPAEKSWQGTR